MRLIDADALLIKIDEANYTAIDIKNLIAEAPTIQREERDKLVGKTDTGAATLRPIDIEKLARDTARYVRRVDGGTEEFAFTPDYLKTFVSKVLEDKEREVAELKEKLTTELKRGGSYKLLVSSLEGQLEHYRNQDYTLAKARLDTLEQSLNSEREMNEILTNEITELQAHVNDLREALEVCKYECHTGEVIGIAQQALSKTPAQHINDDVLIFTKDSLQEHDNELIEKCAKVCDEHGNIWVSKSLRALKQEVK